VIKPHFGDLWEHMPGATSLLMSLLGVTLDDDT
jgi:hypothetical protein